MFQHCSRLLTYEQVNYYPIQSFVMADEKKRGYENKDLSLVFARRKHSNSSPLQLAGEEKRRLKNYTEAFNSEEEDDILR